jgi:hypothetical protein
MSLRHVVCFRFVPGTTAEQAADLTSSLEALPGVIPEIASYRVGPDLGLNDDSWDFVVTADFATEADYRTYQHHPVHLDLIASKVQPLMAERAAAQFAI